MNNNLAIPEDLKVEVFKNTIDNAPAIVEQNQKSVQAATAFVNSLIAKSNEGKLMNDAIDKEMNDCQVKLKTTLKAMKDRRTPITKLFDDVKSYYTKLESELKALDDIIQQYRNMYATEKARLAAEQEKARQRQLAADQEKVNIKAEIEVQLKQYFYEYLDSQQKGITGLFEACTLDNYVQTEALIKRFSAIYSKGHFDMFKVKDIRSLYLSPEQKIEVFNTAKEGKFELFYKEFEDTIKALKEMFLDKLPSKKKQLEEIKKLNDSAENKGIAAQKMLAMATTEQEIRAAKTAISNARDAGFAADALEREADEKLKEELKRLESEKIARTESIKQQSEATKAAENTVNLFNAMQETPVVQTDNIKEGYEIIINNPTGWLPIIAKWFEKEGGSTPADKIGSMTLNRMRTFCEKLAITNGEKVVSQYIEYKPVYAAKTKR